MEILNRGIIKKKKITFYEKIISFYLIRLGFSFFTQRAFILLEMQLNSFLARVKIIPYFFMARDLCFYRLVLVNQKFISNPYFIISLFDTVQLPFFIYNYISYRNNRYTNLPKFFKKYFFFFWRHFTNYNFNQLWLINNYFNSPITGQVIPFEYPNILIYMSPFVRFTKIYFRNHSYSDVKRKSYFGYTNSVFKLKIFSYAQFYK